MNFCPDCNFLLYKNLKSSESNEGNTYENILSPDMSKCSLVEYCKNCGYEKKVAEDNVSVYKRNYKNDFIVDRILKNKYTVYDSTLPRLNTKCKNKFCITNIPGDKLSSKNAITVNNIPENLTKQDIRNILDQFSFGNITKQVNDDEDYIKTINNYDMFVKRLKLTQLIIFFKDISNSKKKKKSTKTSSKKSNSDELTDIIDNFKTFIENFNLEINSLYSSDTVTLKQFKTEEFKMPHNEVIFIKYDPDNMKYLYMCVNCGDSW